MSKLSYEEKLAMKKNAQAKDKDAKKDKADRKEKAAVSRHERSKRARNGAYSLVITSIVIVIVIAINLIINSLPAGYTQHDISSNDYYTLGDKTKELLDSIDQDVTIYYLVEDGKENVYVQGIINQYEGACKKINVKKIDPVAYPTFASQYSDSSLNENSVIVVSGDKSKVVEYSEMFEVSYSQSYETGQTSSSVDAFDGEGRLTSAIAYVTSDSTPVVYELTGHGEQALSGLGISDLIEKENMDLSTLSILTEGKVPDDCATLIINAPTSDISENESSILTDYVNNGGKIIVLTLYNGEDKPDIKTSMPNLTSVLRLFGVEPESGLIIENSSTNYYSNQMYLLPTVNSTDVAGNVYTDNRYVLAPYSSGIKKLDDASSDLNITSILTTSDKSFSKIDVSASSFEQVDEDINGPFDIAVAVANSSNSSKLVYFTSAYMLDPSIDSYVSGANKELFMNALSLSVGSESSISIDSKSLKADPLIVNSMNAGIIKAVTQYIIPIAILAAGAIVWYRRRKK